MPLWITFYRLSRVTLIGFTLGLSLAVGGQEVTQGASFSQVLSEEDYVPSQSTQSHRGEASTANIGGGRILALCLCARGRTKGPPAISVSLLAKAMTFLAVMVATVEKQTLRVGGIVHFLQWRSLRGDVGNPYLDFFFHVIPDTLSETLTERLKFAWEHDPLKSLKLVYNLRVVWSTGKSDREDGDTAALWLHANTPKP
ncbi:lipoyl synthase [Striga asiatica]|uniref:Lipoyl synthase n=1 Tax=Striga asiatica TaxID=4170 RepID=A0A5A7QLA4_STRAF|nr:lipoyl synthase [Striga asiatica]